MWGTVVTSEPRKIGAPGLSGSGIRFQCLVPAEMASKYRREISMLPSPLVVYVGVHCGEACRGGSRDADGGSDLCRTQMNIFLLAIPVHLSLILPLSIRRSVVA